jgi:hypothetical protein
MQCAARPNMIYHHQNNICYQLTGWFALSLIMVLKEDFLSFIWQFRLFTSRAMLATSGEKLEILDPGFLNNHAGPDFFNAKIKIGDTVWIGNIEMHIRSSDWTAHGHSVNTAYDNVVLHVVYEDDLPVRRTDGSAIQTLVVKDNFPMHLLDRYQALVSGMAVFPCANQINTIDPIILHNCFSRVLLERYEAKYHDVSLILKHSKGNWEAVFYYLLARSFGFKTNSIPFELLARSIDHQYFAKYKDNPIQIEALIFGQAGFLSANFEESYPAQLKSEYEFLRKKFSLQALDPSIWKFLRMRPASFPTVRLAQFAALMIKSQHLFSLILEAGSLKSIKSHFEHLPVHSYWTNHYHFGKASLPSATQLGRLSIENIIINTVCMLLFSYGKTMDQPAYIDQSFRILEQLQGEKNSITGHYKDSGIKIENAFVSQAILELNKSYCSKKKCLNCSIGVKILKK